MTDDNIIEFKILPKRDLSNAPTARFKDNTIRDPKDPCRSGHSYEIDTEAGIAECLQCKKHFTLLHIIGVMLENESLYMRRKEEYKKEQIRLEQREKTKCEHCNKMTKISKGWTTAI